jgi:hypothetical protein
METTGNKKILIFKNYILLIWIIYMYQYIQYTLIDIGIFIEISYGKYNKLLDI